MILTAKIVLSYLAGSVIGGLVIGRLRGGVDIRTVGSGNAGGTNALRTQGPWFAAGVILIDIGKGLLAAGVIAPAGGMHAAAPYLCGAAAVIGHVYPLWFGFRGGKGAATLVGVVAILHWQLLIPVVSVWLAVIAITGYVGLATVLSSVAASAYVWVVERPDDLYLGIFTIAMALLIVFTHRSNIFRMLAGTESRNARLSLFGRKR